MFDTKLASRELRAYRKKGPAKTTRVMLDWIRELGHDRLSLLDVGGGVGAIQHELFKSGTLASAVHVDAAQPYLIVSKEEAKRLGHADQVTYTKGDFTEIASGLDPADVVTLDRVICCYPDMPAMLNAAAGRATRFIGLVLPRDMWFHRLFERFGNAMLWFSTNPFRFFVHSTAEIDAILTKHGFRRQYHKAFFVWQTMVYVRTGPSAD